jgi:putative DNA methylase
MRRPRRTAPSSRVARTSAAWCKAEELVATPYRHGNKEQAEQFFLGGMTRAMQRLASQAHPAFPVTIYYAFKQSETETAEDTASTGWETFLEAVSRRPTSRR